MPILMMSERDAPAEALAGLPHVRLAREALALGPGAGLPAVFLHRAQLAAIPASPAQSFVETPAHLIDLGVRRWREPQVFFEESLRLRPEWQGRWSALVADQDSAMERVLAGWRQGAVSAPEVEAVTESLAVFTGDLVTAGRLADGVLAAERPVDDVRLAVVLATLICWPRPGDAVALLHRAAALSRTIIGGYLVQLRIAAVLSKRADRQDEAMAVLDRVEHDVLAAGARHRMAAADQGAIRALVANLRALVNLRRGDRAGALAAVTESAGLMPDGGFVLVSRDMADRYRAQVRINLCLMYLLLGRGHEAVAAADLHVRATRREHPYSLSEALTVAAYVHQQQGVPAMALSYCREAEPLLRREGAPVRLRLCRQVAVAALAAAGRSTKAAALARALAADPLGLRRLL
ncbi:hypothetical protein [Cellulomonas hominis]